jgi:alpha-mannosidase
VETIKVSDDGRALILRLFGIRGLDESVTLSWKTVKPASVWVTDLTEKPLRRAGAQVAVPAFGVVQLRAELP